MNERNIHELTRENSQSYDKPTHMILDIEHCSLCSKPFASRKPFKCHPYPTNPNPDRCRHFDKARTSSPRPDPRAYTTALAPPWSPCSTGEGASASGPRVPSAPACTAACRSLGLWCIAAPLQDVWAGDTSCSPATAFSDSEASGCGLVGLGLGARGWCMCSHCEGRARRGGRVGRGGDVERWIWWGGSWRCGEGLGSNLWALGPWGLMLGETGWAEGELHRMEGHCVRRTLETLGILRAWRVAWELPGCMSNTIRG